MVALSHASRVWNWSLDIGHSAGRLFLPKQEMTESFLLIPPDSQVHPSPPPANTLLASITRNTQYNPHGVARGSLEVSTDRRPPSALSKPEVGMPYF